MADVDRVPLGDGIVTLRPLTEGDAAAHLAGEDAELVRWLSGGAGTSETVWQYIQQAQRMWDDDGPIFTFGVHDAIDDVLVGTIDVQLNQPAFRPDQANLAYGLYPGARGRGFATRAVHLAIEFLRVGTCARTALIRVEPGNFRSAAVAVRAGFTPAAAASVDGLLWYERDVW